MTDTTTPESRGEQPAVLKRFLFLGPTGAGKLLFETIQDYGVILY
jgi:hypothetical protein